MKRYTVIGFYKHTHKPIILHLECECEPVFCDWILSRANMHLYHQHDSKMPSVNWVTILPGHHDPLIDWAEYFEVDRKTFKPS